jgi:glycosyltransferase involved in cell wall biosynthesis
MNIFLDNVDLSSRSGPNHFARKLKKYMERQGDTFTFAEVFDVQLSFIEARNKVTKNLVQRLDGIYFNDQFDYMSQNDPILKTYRDARGVIFQSEFNRRLSFEFFGNHDNYRVIRNGADLEFINSIKPLDHEVINKHEKVWSCASSWRPHKRLNENIRYFLEHSDPNDCMVVAGDVPNPIIQERVYYVGNLDIHTLISLYKKSDYFIHLAFLDHCPNVVVDAVACGCKVICSSSGGTKEVAVGATLIEEDEWDFRPLRLYEPPAMDFTRKKENNYDTNIDMAYVASQYNKFLGEIR